MSGALSLRRFAAVELLVWASVYPAYLAIRSSSIDGHREAVAHATELVDLERATGLLREADVQSLFHPIVDFFSAYYMLGFGPLIATVLIWLGIRHRDHYRRLRTLLFASLGTTPAPSPGSASTRTRPCRACTSAGACSSGSSAFAPPARAGPKASSSSTRS
jgi:hypothetical protein